MSQRSIHLPVAWWKLDDLEGSTVCKDWSGNGYHGLYTNSPTLGVGGAFGNSKAVTFASASSQYMRVTAPAMLNNVSAATLTGWVKNSTAATQTFLNLSTGTSAGSDPRISLKCDSSGKMTANCRAGDGETTQSVTDTSATTDGVFHHWAVVVDYAADTIVLYKDGVAVSTTGTVSFTATATSATNPQNFWLAVLNGGAQFADATIDDVRIYDFALEPSEVLGLYNFSDIPYGETDIFTNNIYDRNIPETVGIITSPKNGVYRINDRGVKDIVIAQDLLNGVVNQTFQVSNI